MLLRQNLPIRIQPYFGYRNAEILRVSCRALRAGKSSFSRGGRWQAMRTMIAQFVSHEIAGFPVALHLKSPDGQITEHRAVTDEEGFAHFEVEIADWRLPERASWEVVSFHWQDDGETHCVEGHVLVPGVQTDLAVISDIDDTIIETGITGDVRAVLRNWRRVLAQMPEERLHVPGVDAFYGALGGGAVLDEGDDTDIGESVPTTFDRPFFYVSSSPWNLYSYLVAFKKGRKLPLGPVALRDWGLNRETFGSSSHGAHKRAAIDRILATYPNLKFALIGDDTQGDLTAFGKVATDYPDRIAAVFIRKAGEAMTEKELAAKQAIQEAEVPLWLGDDYSTGEAFLREAGLARDDEARQIVETVETKGEESQV